MSATTVIAPACYPLLIDAKPSHLIVACPDPRCQYAIAGFIENELKLKMGQYVFLGELGGLVGFSAPASHISLQKHMESSLQFTFETFPSIGHCIFINHESCARYQFFADQLGMHFLRGMRSVADRQKEDLRRAANAVPKLTHKDNFFSIHRYYMRYADSSKKSVYFERLE